MRAVWPALLVLLVAPAPSWAADARVNFFSKQLSTAKDPRGRSQAAIALGIYGDPAAIPALCSALADKEELVVVAAAKALDSIGDVSALGCLRGAKASGGAATAIAGAIKSLGALSSLKPKLYVLIDPPANSAGLPDEQLALITDRLKAKFQRVGALFAPAGEPKATAQRVLKTKKLEGVMVMTTVEKNGAGLALTMVVLSYPDKLVKGQMSAKASGGKPEDLIRALVPKVVDEAADEFQWGE